MRTGGGRVWSLVVIPFHLVSAMLARSPNVLFTGGEYVLDMFTFHSRLLLRVFTYLHLLLCSLI